MAVFEEGAIPVEFGGVEQARSCSHSQGAVCIAQEGLLEPVGGGDPAFDALEQGGIGTAQPNEFCGPERGADHAPGAGVNGALGEALAQGGGVLPAAGVGPGDDGSQWISVGVRSEEAVPETGDADSRDFAAPEGGLVSGKVQRLGEAVANGEEQASGVHLGGAIRGGCEGVRLLCGGVEDALAGFVKESGAGGGGSDVDREEQRSHGGQGVGRERDWRRACSITEIGAGVWNQISNARAP